MTLPLSLEKIILNLLEGVSTPLLDKAQQELSLAYRAQTEKNALKKVFLNTDVQRLVYLGTRFPPIYAAIQAIAEKFISKIEPGSIQSMLDLGAGPATCYLALREFFPFLTTIDLIERDLGMSQLGRKLLEGQRGFKYHSQNLETLDLKQTYDLITASYSLSELSLDHLKKLVPKLWQFTSRHLLIVESGTPYGFETILEIRKMLLEQGAFILLPCPGEMACPMAVNSQKQWCHFAVRLQRNQFQRLLKRATLGYEDEKYSYLIATKVPPLQRNERIVKTPEKHSGHVRLTLCTNEGLIQKTISKKHDNYKSLRKAEWGDAF